MLLYHHCRALESVVYDEVKPNPKYSDPHLKQTYFWVEREKGFYPLFLAVGKTLDDIKMTGYQSQWNRLKSLKLWKGKDGKNKRRATYVKPGEFDNDVLFSFTNVTGVYTDYDRWFYAMNIDVGLTPYEKRLIFKPSWPESKWIAKALKQPHTVQLLTQKLDLRQAARVWCRNQPTKHVLEEMGFRNVEVKRIPCNRWRL